MSSSARAHQRTGPGVSRAHCATWWWSERTVWAVAAYRAAQWARETPGPVRWCARALLDIAYPLIQAFTGIELWPATYVGPGLRIYHGTGIVINPGTHVGARCILRQGVTLGLREAGGEGCPRIGDDVEFGAYAQVLGPVTVGDGARVGAMSVVLHDVPAHATVAGAPARVIGVHPPAE